jgi:hypothetical protein
LGPFPFGWERGLLTGDVEGAPFRQSGRDRLTGKDALHGARLNEVIFDTVHGQAGPRFDLRGALQSRMAYPGLLVLGAVEKLSWDGETRHTARTVGNAAASVPVHQEGTINLRLFFRPGAEPTEVARSALF